MKSVSSSIEPIFQQIIIILNFSRCLEAVRTVQQEINVFKIYLILQLHSQNIIPVLLNLLCSKAIWSWGMILAKSAWGSGFKSRKIAIETNIFIQLGCWLYFMSKYCILLCIGHNFFNLSIICIINFKLRELFVTWRSLLLVHVLTFVAFQ